MDDKLAALAEACERAATFAYTESGRQYLNAREAGHTAMAETAERLASEAGRVAVMLDRHARAIREGRVTVNEGGENA